MSAASARWLRGAAVYNVLWGGGVALFAPGPAWKCVGMMVLVYAPGYWAAARRPLPELVAVGLLGKTLGPVGFVWAYAHGMLPPAFGLVVLANDVLWWPAFVRYLRETTRAPVAIAASPAPTAATARKRAAASGPPSSHPNVMHTASVISSSPTRSTRPLVS